MSPERCHQRTRAPLCHSPLPHAKIPALTTMRRFSLESLSFAQLLIDGIVEKKGSDIILLDIKEQAVFADYFIICSGDSRRQLQALANGVVADAREQAKIRPQNVEGDADGGWILVDFGEIIVHIFAEATREYYALEELWGEAYTVLRMQ